MTIDHVHTAQYSHTVAQGADHYRRDIVIRVELDIFNIFKQELGFKVSVMVQEFWPRRLSSGVYDYELELELSQSIVLHAALLQAFVFSIALNWVIAVPHACWSLS